MSVGEYRMAWRGIGYRELRKGTPRETMIRNEAKATRLLASSWDTRDDWYKALLGACNLVTIGNYLYPSRQVPHYHPKFDNIPYSNTGPYLGPIPGATVPYLYATGLSGDGFIPDGDIPKEIGVSDTEGGEPGNFEEVITTVEYSSAPFVMMDDETLGEFGLAGEAPFNDESFLLRYVYGKIIPSPKYQSIPRADSIRWASDFQPVTNEAAVPLVEADVILKWFDVNPALYSLETVANLAGKVNKYDFGHPLFFLGVFPAGTLVFITADVDMFRRATGEIYLDITYRFRYYPNKANYFYRNDSLIASLQAGATKDGTVPTGPGYYFAARGVRKGDGSFNIHPEVDTVFYEANPTYLIFPPGDFTDLFRRKLA